MKSCDDSSSICSHDSRVLDAIDILSTLVDPYNLEQTQLLVDIQSDPYSQDSQQKIIDLLVRIISAYDFKQFKDIPNEHQVVIRLVSHLQSHVALLQAITHNAELASLFLVGENGSTSFSQLQKSILLEQASRTKLYLQSFVNSNQTDAISDFRKNLSNLRSFSEKIQELKQIQETTKSSDDIEDVRAAFHEVSALLETSILFNDLLINTKTSNQVNALKSSFPDAPQDNAQFEKWVKHYVKKGLNYKQTIQSTETETQQEITDLQQQLKVYQSKQGEYQKQINNLQKENNHLVQKLKDYKVAAKTECDDSEQIMNLQNTITRIKKKNRELKSKIHEFCLNVTNDSEECNPDDFKTLKLENQQLLGQIKLSQNQIINYQSMLSQKETKINQLTSKANELSKIVREQNELKNQHLKEIDNLQSLYQNINQQVRKVSISNEEQTRLTKKFNKEKKHLEEENLELKHMLEHATEAAKQQMKEYYALLKQMRRRDEQCDPNIISDLQDKCASLANQLREAHAFIDKLKEEIAQFRKNQQHNSYTEIPTYTHVIEPLSKYVPTTKIKSVEVESNFSPDSSISANFDALDRDISELEERVRISQQMQKEFHIKNSNE